MAVIPNLNPVASGYNLSKINDNFQKIEEAFQEVLGRNGDLPNQMEADIDMNGNDLLNIGLLSVEDITVDGDSVVGILERAEEAADEAQADATAAAASATSATASAAAAAASAASIGNFTQEGTGAVPRSIYLKLLDTGPTPEDYTASTINDYTTDATDAIQKALTYAASNGEAVRMGAGTYKIGGTLSIGGNGTSIEGVGGLGTILKSPNATNTIIEIGGGLSNIKVRRLELNRAVPGTFGAFGLKTPNNAYIDATLEEIWARWHYIGFQLGATTYAHGQMLRAENNTSHGFFQTNGAAAIGGQWYLQNIYSGNNGGNGFLAQADAAAEVGFPIGELDNYQSFGNSGRGYVALGTADCPIPSVRLSRIFIGQDGDDEIYLDTYGGANNQITSFHIELPGTSLTGPSGATAATGDGFGIVLTANTPDLQLSNGIINGCSDGGIYNSSPGLKAINVKSINNTGNGFANHAGESLLEDCEAYGNTSYGIAVVTGTVKVSGRSDSFAGNTLGSVGYFGGNIYGYTGWRDFTPTVTAHTNTLTSSTVNWFVFRHDDNLVDFDFSITVPDKGSGTVGLLVTMPVAPTGVIFAMGKEAGVTAKPLHAEWTGTHLLIRFFDATLSDPLANGAIFQVSGSYRVAN